MPDFPKPDISLQQLEILIKTYQNTVKRIRKGDDSGIASDYDPDFDSKSVWFPRNAVEQLFNDNNADGLRVYFGVHDADHMPTPYDDRLTVIFVATKFEDGKNKDQLKDSAMANNDDLKSGAGYALNHAAVCPPRCT